MRTRLLIIRRNEQGTRRARFKGLENAQQAVTAAFVAMRSILTDLHLSSDRVSW